MITFINPREREACDVYASLTSMQINFISDSNTDRKSIIMQQLLRLTQIDKHDMIAVIST